MTLVALIALTTHAWADDKKVVLKVDPITVANGSEAVIKVKMDYTAEKTLVGLSFSLYLPDGILLKGFDTKEAQDAAKASALMKAFDLDVTTGLWGNEEGASGWFYVKRQVDGGFLINIIDQDEKTAFVNTHAPVISVYVHAVADVANVNGTINGITLTDNENNSVEQGNIAEVLIPFNTPSASTATTVPLTWDAATPNTATLTNGMPAGNVTVSVEYYPQATMAAGAVTAATDVKATTEDALVTIDKNKLTGVAKLMYYVSTKTTAPDYDTEGWTDQVPTAANYTEAGNVNVWYYAVGTDEGVGEATATYSDGDMNAEPLTVTLAAAPLWNAEFDLTNAPEEDKAGKWSTDIPEGGVVKGTEVTVTYTGSKKIIGVKAEKKSAFTPLDNTITAWTAGKYAVPAGGLTYSAAITVSGDVTLVLTDDETLTLNKGISLAEGATLTVEGNGTMNINGTNNSTASTVAGTGMLVLTSGTLNAKGGDGGNASSGYTSGGGNAINGAVTVSGGTLTATGGNGGSDNSVPWYDEDEEGWVGGSGYRGDGAWAISGDVIITAGIVTAKGGNGGSLPNGSDAYAGAGGNAINGNVTLSGGTLTKTDGNSGTKGADAAGYVGAGRKAVAGTVTNNGGTVN